MANEAEHAAEQGHDASLSHPQHAPLRYPPFPFDSYHFIREPRSWILSLSAMVSSKCNWWPRLGRRCAGSPLRNKTGHGQVQRSRPLVTRSGRKQAPAQVKSATCGIPRKISVTREPFASPKLPREPGWWIRDTQYAFQTQLSFRHSRNGLRFGSLCFGTPGAGIGDAGGSRDRPRINQPHFQK